MSRDLNGANALQTVGSWIRIWMPNPNYASEVKKCDDKIAEYTTMKTQISNLITQLQTDVGNLNYSYDCLCTAIVDSDNPGLFNQVQEYSKTYQKAAGDLESAITSADNDIRNIEAQRDAIPKGWWIWQEGKGEN